MKRIEHWAEYYDEYGWIEYSAGENDALRASVGMAAYTRHRGSFEPWRWWIIVEIQP
jgi:hypothetical protein